MAAAQATGCQEQKIFMYDVYFKITHNMYMYVCVYIYICMYDVYNAIHVHIYHLCICMRIYLNVYMYSNYRTSPGTIVR